MVKGVLKPTEGIVRILRLRKTEDITGRNDSFSETSSEADRAVRNHSSSSFTTWVSGITVLHKTDLGRKGSTVLRDT